MKTPGLPELPTVEPAPAEPLLPSDDEDEDGDGLIGVADACPARPELYNGVEDDDGCPDAGASGLALASSGRLLIEHEPVLFLWDSSAVHENSRPLLDDLASLVLRNGHLGVLMVEVHSDSRGSDRHNLELTQGRAETIAAHLEARGVPSARVRAEGFGEERPISHCPPSRPRCRRRVDLWFRIPSPEAP